MKQHKQNKAQIITCFMCCFFVLTVGGSVNGTHSNDDNLAQKCAQEVQKVIPCLNFVTGKGDTPSKECCDAAMEIKETGPKCLCYIIQQTHHGSPESKSAGVREDRLLQLPSACDVKNVSISDCPKLLGLSPSSPDTAIFTNASKVTPAPSSTHASPSTPQSKSASYGIMLRPPAITGLAVALAIVLVAIPTGFVRIHA